MTTAAAAAERDRNERMADTVLRCSGMYGLLCEIMGKGALLAHGDSDLTYRVQRAIADHETALKKSMEASRG